MHRLPRKNALCTTFSGFGKCFQTPYRAAAGGQAYSGSTVPQTYTTKRTRRTSFVGGGEHNAFVVAKCYCAATSPTDISTAGSTRTSVVHTTHSKAASARAVAATQAAHATLLGAFSTLLEDRRVCYKDSYVEAQLAGPRMQLTTHLLELWSDVEAAKCFREKLQDTSGQSPDSGSGASTVAPLFLRPEHVRSLKEDYIRGAQTAAAPTSVQDAVVVRTVLRFYTALMASGLVDSEAEMRMVLDEMRTTDLVEPTAAVYQSLLCSLLLVTREKSAASVSAPPRTTTTATEKETTTEGAHDTKTAGPASPDAPAKVKAGDMVVGEIKKLHRAEVGDLAGYYMGHALSHHRTGQSHYPAHLLTSTTDRSLNPDTPQQQEEKRAALVEYVNADLWGTFLSICAMTHVAPKIMDLWWKKFVTFFDAERSIAKKKRIFADQEGEKDGGRDADLPHDLTESFLADLIATEADAPASSSATEVDDKSPLPYIGVHAMVSWAAAQRDIERVMKYFHETNKRGVWLPDGTFFPPGCLTLPLTELQKRYPAWQQQQQQPRGAPTQEGLQEMQLRMLAKLMAASKSVKMDGGLRELVSKDVRQLIPLPVLKRAPWGVLSDLMTGLSVSSTMQLLKLASSSRPNGDGDVPFFVWASILRRCAHEHYLDQAESLFRFIRARFQLGTKEKRELVEIMMRMYSSLAPPDFSSTLAMFNDHVLRTPKGEAAVPCDAALYTILIKAADSRETATMLFLEACGDGVQLDADLFEAVLGANQHHVMSQLSRKLPHEYGTSDLDAQLRIPQNVDAHARREEALQLRGKALYPSTGETGY